MTSFSNIIFDRNSPVVLKSSVVALSVVDLYVVTVMLSSAANKETNDLDMLKPVTLWRLGTFLLHSRRLDVSRHFLANLLVISDYI